MSPSTLKMKRWTWLSDHPLIIAPTQLTSIANMLFVTAALVEQDLLLSSIIKTKQDMQRNYLVTIALAITAIITLTLDFSVSISSHIIASKWLIIVQ